MATESVRTVRNNFSDVIGRVQHQHERVTITKNGAPAAVMISPEDLESMEETLTILSEPGVRSELAEAEQSILEGDVVVGADAIRALRQT
ncbi:MAG: type II toxin-antitoxin system Phd/YefM family antitoxin [Microthrixaceae bacterium]